MSGNVRRNLAVQLTAGGTNPLKLQLTGVLPYRKGTAVNASLVGQGGLLPYAFSIIVGSLPAGLSLNASTGAITGTPTTVAANTFTAQVQDANSTIFTGTFEMDVHANLVVVTGTPSACEALVAYSYTFSITGNTGAVTWALTSGTLPPNLSLASNGVLSGTPSTAAGKTYIFTLTATDAGSGDALQVAASMVKADTLIMPSGPLARNAVVGVQYTFTVSASQGVPPYTYAISPSVTGVSVALTGGVVTWNFSSAGTQNVSVVATDALGVQRTTGYVVKVVLATVSTDAGNATILGSDSAFFTPTGAGGVTSVGATAPVASSGGTTPTISMPAATGSVDGYLSASAQTIGGAKTFSVDVTVNGITVGKGKSSLSNNVAVGTAALSSITSGGTNLGVGYSALNSTTTGASNTAFGSQTLSSNIAGSYNVGISSGALFTCNADGNVAIGYNALYFVSSGTYNVGIGYGGCDNVTSGSFNVGIGDQAWVPSATANGQLSIQNIIYGFANTAVQSAVSTGRIAIGQSTDDGVSKLQVAGQVKANNYGSALVSKGTITTAVTIDWTAGDHQTFTQTSLNNPTITFTAPANPCRLWLKVVAPASGTTGTMTWPATMKGSPPTTVTLAKVSAYQFDWDGTNYFYMGGCLNV